MKIFSRQAKTPAGLDRRYKRETVAFSSSKLADWIIIMAATGFFLLGAVAINIFIFRGVNSEELFLVEKQEPLPFDKISKDALRRTISHFEKKQTRFEELRLKKLLSADPSI